MILIGLGANIPSAPSIPPQATLARALEALEEEGVRVLARSRWYRSAPVPISDQPWFINAVAAVATELSPAPLMALLHRIEARFGRVRRQRNEARPLDLDLLAYGTRVETGEGGLILPHPRLENRAFVLLPLAEIAPEWRHPVSDAAISSLIAALPPDQTAEPLD
ncbi:MAG TPA: 2-amino-4-hydroxy-6-hydroxymethyldihydropteridine diphosphokinase [Stellaceae bacterium]|nr:2-amino-4-hydroxy-6-hydroxymethyldihydropteridine diphosphokinase [Stellaceae bacterium]